jgi:hypothetical protein
MEKSRSTTLRLGTGQQLIPRDISESLGKLPPGSEASQDLEPAILGALMLEVNSINEVKFLLPDHFYDDRHKEVFRAIRNVHLKNIKPDMRSVVNELRTTGKIEIVGGAYYIAELTSKVSSAANIVHHSRIIVELAMKRRLIEIASQIHHDAYEDTSDIFKMLEIAQQDLKFLEERETKSSGPERIKALWEKYRITVKPVRPETLIKIGDADVMTVGNISMIVGKKKSRKSLLLAYLIQIFLKPRHIVADDILFFDTEQEEYDVWMAQDRIYRMTYQYVPMFCLRGLSTKERREFIEQTTKHWHKPVKIIFLDGIRDCLSNINDPDESTEVVGWLMRMNVEYKVHISTVLHLNKTDNNARGHIGTELLNKAEITIEVELDERVDKFNPPSVVKVESSRRQPFEPFVFTHGPTGLPELLGAPVGMDVVSQDEQLQKLAQAFEGEVLKGKEAAQALKDHFAVGDSKARQLLTKFINKGWIVKSGKTNSPNTSYKLVATPGQEIARKAEIPPVIEHQPEQGALFDSGPPKDFVPPPEDIGDLPF